MPLMFTGNCILFASDQLSRWSSCPLVSRKLTMEINDFDLQKLVSQILAVFYVMYIHTTAKMLSTQTSWAITIVLENSSVFDTAYTLFSLYFALHSPCCET